MPWQGRDASRASAYQEIKRPIVMSHQEKKILELFIVVTILPFFARRVIFAVGLKDIRANATEKEYQVRGGCKP